MLTHVAFVKPVVIDHWHYESVSSEDDLSIRYAKRDFAQGILISYPRKDQADGICFVPFSNIKYVLEEYVER